MGDSDSDKWDWQIDKSTADTSKWTFDAETFLRFFGHGAPITIESGGEIRNPQNQRRAFLAHDGVNRLGLLILIKQDSLDVLYRRLLMIQPHAHKSRHVKGGKHVALLHTVQGVSYDEFGNLRGPFLDFGGLLHDNLTQPKADFLALTDTIGNWTPTDCSRPANIGSLQATKLELGRELPEKNNLILVLHPSISMAVIEEAEALVGGDLPAAGPFVSTKDGTLVLQGAEHTLDPGYGLHLPQVEVDKLFWAVDGSALDQPDKVSIEARNIKKRKPTSSPENEVRKEEPPAKIPIFGSDQVSRPRNKGKKQRVDPPLE